MPKTDGSNGSRCLSTFEIKNQMAQIRPKSSGSLERTSRGGWRGVGQRPGGTTARGRIRPAGLSSRSTTAGGSCRSTAATGRGRKRRWVASF